MEMTFAKASLYKTAVMKEDVPPFKKGEVVGVKFAIRNVLTGDFFFTCKSGEREKMICHRSLESFVL